MTTRGPAQQDSEPHPFADGLVCGGAFVLDQPDGIPARWGDGEQVLHAEGEALMIAGPQGIGKTTLALLYLAAMLGLTDAVVLGLPVTPARRVLYLAMDRPRQIARALRRIAGHIDREQLDSRLIVWNGPPLADMAKNPGLLDELAAHVGADVVFVDSLKDAALGLSEDEVGAAWNRARQMAIRAGVDVVELHHTRKGDGKGRSPDIGDIYGSTWLTSGAGSVVLLDGKPGDPYVKFHHVKAPAVQLGPWTVLHDQTSGTMTVHQSVDVVALALATPGGLTARQAAQAVYEKDNPTASEKEKARRRLDKLVEAGQLREVPGVSSTSGTRYLHADDPHGLGSESPVSHLHAPLHAASSRGTPNPTDSATRDEANEQVTTTRPTARATRVATTRQRGVLKNPSGVFGDFPQAQSGDPATPYEVPAGAKLSPGEHTPIILTAKNGRPRAVARYVPTAGGPAARVDKIGRTDSEAWEKARAALLDQLSTGRETTT
ncbi:MAG: AAA family ATPase [Gordonia sp. (in: high G+C Gram-positive bacteria)]